jgi:hypothetical protein
MVRALPDKKAHADKKKGTEPLGRKVKEKQTTVEDNSTSSRKKYFTELPVGVLPKIGNPSLEKEENDNVAVLFELEKKIEQGHPPKFTPNLPAYPRRRTYWITKPSNEPPTRGGGGAMPIRNTKNTPGVCGGGCSFLACF